MSIDDFEMLRSKIRFNFNEDSHYSELKNIELMRERLSIAAGLDPYIGRYFSNSYIRREVFGMSEDTENRNFSEIQAEIKSGEISTETPEETGEEQ